MYKFVLFKDLMDNDNACEIDMIQAFQDSVTEKCKSSYLQNEMWSIHEIGKNLAIYECFLQKFEQRCLEFFTYTPD